MSVMGRLSAIIKRPGNASTTQDGYDWDSLRSPYESGSPMTPMTPIEHTLQDLQLEQNITFTTSEDETCIKIQAQLPKAAQSTLDVKVNSKNVYIYFYTKPGIKSSKQKRKFRLPDNADTKKIDARFSRTAFLCVVVPKKNKKK
ncbi:hypothetical protein AKO1_001328 [Acrasis kona]|uniref:SHSP domain-containing protein n=1 Tax=Acrasis kona TaxID=1008807 RepID=A0AAW2ZEC4_9EUKA